MWRPYKLKPQGKIGITPCHSPIITIKLLGAYRNAMIHIFSFKTSTFDFVLYDFFNVV